MTKVAPITFDTTSLANQLTIRQSLAELRRSGAAFRLGFSILFLVTFLPPFILLLVALQTKVEMGVLFFLAVLTVGGLIGLKDLYRELNEAAQARIFAQANGMAFYRDVSKTGYPGTPFRTKIYVPFTMRSPGELFVEFGFLRPDYAHRRSNNSITYTFMRLKLPKALPHIVLKRRGQTTIDYVPADSVILKLEGQFGDLYDLYAPKGYERDALYIFTPDVIERFIDATPDFDCEIVGDELYFYSSNKITFIYPQNLQKLVAIMNHVLQKFSRQSGKYEDDRLDSTVLAPSALKMRASTGTNLVLGTLAVMAVVILVLQFTK